MPKQKRVNPKTIYSSLTPEDFATFVELATRRKITHAELMREAVLFYLSYQEKLQSEEKDGRLEKRLRKMEDRLAGLLARTAIDVGVVYNMIWQNMPEERREKAFKTAYKQSVQRIKQKFSAEEDDVKVLGA